jgi:hypothetical protein
MLFLCFITFIIIIIISFRFDISFPAFEFCKTFFNPDYNLVCVTEAFDEANDDSTMDTLSTAHFGLLALYMGGMYCMTSLP